MRMRHILAFLLSTLCAVNAFSQAATGVYQNGSFDVKGFDAINLGNLNTHFSVPIFSKPGRGGANFSFNLLYDGSIWSTAGVGSTTVWSPAQNFGWKGDQKPLPIAGELYFNQSTVQCGYYDSSDNESYSYYSYNYNYVYYDEPGVAHSFPGYIGGCPDGGDPGNTPMSSSLGASVDGITVNGDNTVSLPDGSKVTPGVNFYTAATFAALSDINGNQITWNNGVLTDTTGTNVLTAADGSFTYPTVGGSATTQVTYQPYTVQTNFGCSGIVEYGPQSTSLVDRITFADGSYYGFSYEPTPGVSGSVTARISSIRLPTGGTIDYVYSGSLSGACSNGMNSNGVPGKMIRTADGSQTSYDTTISPNFTRIVSPTNATTDLTFRQTSNSAYYETDRKVFSGISQGTPLLHTVTCYGYGDCAPVLPITFISKTSTYDGLATNGSDALLDTDGNVTEVDLYGFGQNGSRGPILESALTSFATFGSDDYKVTRVVDASVNDGAGHQISHSHFGFDEQPLTPTSGLPQHNGFTSGARGTPSSLRQTTGSSQDLVTTYIYDDAGSIKSSTGMTGTTTYGYEATDTFVTTTTLPTPSSGVSLATSANYDLATGVVTSSTGMNAGQITQVTQYDRLLRPAVISLPNGGQIQYNYEDTNQIGVYQPLGNNINTSTETLFDGYGRKSRVAVLNGQSSNPWYQTDYCYDATGLLQFQSMQYQGNGWDTPKQCSGNGTSYVYDALGRVTSSTNPDGTTSYQYNGRAVLKTDVNGVQRITQSDLLGRISGVCEISSNANIPGQELPARCGMDIAGTGFATTYSYDLANHKTTVTQGHQTRVFQTDAAGRATQTNEPERGQTTYGYAYNSTGLVVTRQRPTANQTSSSTLTTTTTQYDSVGRVVSISYSDGTPTKNFAYDQSGAWGGSVSLGASKGMLTQHTTNVAGNWAGAAYGYDIMGRVIWNDQCVPSGCGTTSHDKLLSYSYDYIGNMTSASDGADVTTSYSYSPANEVLSITSSLSDATHPGTLVSNVQNGPNGPLSYQSGNGAISSFSYDTAGRRNGGWVCNNSTQNGCGEGTQLYGYNASWKGSRVTNSSDTALNQQSTYGYDEFNRLASQTVTSGPVQNYTYAYDRYGNRWQQNALQGGPSPQLSFDTSTNRVAGYSYDAAGNVMTDGVNTYQYDAEGNLIQETSGSSIRYSYNALNQQVRTDASWGATENVFNLAGHIASLWYSNGNPIMGKAYWGSTPIESYIASKNMAYFQHRDWLGSLRLETNGTGAVIDTRTSFVFGDGAANASGNRDNSFDGFTGFWDGASSATNHAQFREYSNIAGRWLQPDPYDGSYDTNDPQSFNRYGYVLNAPLSAIDPWGLDYGYDCGPYCAGVVASDNGADYWLDSAPIPFIGYQNFPFYNQQLIATPPAPSKPITCSTKLPNGQTVGQYINQGRAQLQAIVDSQIAIAQAGGDINPLRVYTAFASIVKGGGPIDFKNIFSGQASREILGDSGNFAYYAIGEGYIPNTALDLGAGAYGLYGVAVGRFPSSFLTGRFYSDDSANRQRGPGLAANGCPVS